MRDRTPERTVAIPKRAKPTIGGDAADAHRPGRAKVWPLLGHVALVHADERDHADGVPDRADGASAKAVQTKRGNARAWNALRIGEREEQGGEPDEDQGDEEAALERQGPGDGPEPGDGEDHGTEDGGDAADTKRHGESPSLYDAGAVGPRDRSRASSAPRRMSATSYGPSGRSSRIARNSSP